MGGDPVTAIEPPELPVHLEKVDGFSQTLGADGLHKLLEFLLV
jgi:hypothetical protein